MQRPGNLDGKKIVMVTRDPLDRIVSAFNYRHPYRGYPTIHDKAIPGSGDATEVALYQCFDHVNEFAEALSGTGPCPDLARSLFDCCDNMPPFIFIGQGYQYYVGASGIESFVHRNYTLTHVDTLDEDMIKIAQNWLGCRPPTADMPHLRSEYAKNDTKWEAKDALALVHGVTWWQ